MKFFFCKLKNREGKTRSFHFNLSLCQKIGLGFRVEIERPMGTIFQWEEVGVYSVPLGIWTHRDESRRLFGLNVLFFGVHIALNE